MPTGRWPQSIQPGLAAREHVWNLADGHAPSHDVNAQSPLIIDIDTTLVTAHIEKEHAKPTYKKGFGFHPLLAFVDHGHPGRGEPVAELLRPGNLSIVAGLIDTSSPCTFVL